MSSDRTSRMKPLQSSFCRALLLPWILAWALPANAQPPNPLGQAPACPPAVSFMHAASVPGDIDFGNNLAHEFIYCESLDCGKSGANSCERQPFLCVPDSWCKGQIQGDFQDVYHQRFFLDSNTIPNGMDRNQTNGLEQAELVFYAGHGKPGLITAWQNMDVDLTTMSLGDCRTRYWWMLSCKVMAHGPRCTKPTAANPIPVCGAPAGAGSDFLAPEKFDSGSVHFNVFAEWAAPTGTPSSPRTPLNANLRMACGGSTEVGGYFSFPTAPIWHYKLMTQLPVADSFLLGLAQDSHVPLCITRGGSERERTPLYDQEFTKAPNPAPNGDHLYMQYPVPLPPPFTSLENALQQRFEFAGP